MSALLPIFLFVPIALTALFEIELLSKLRSFTEPDDDGNVSRIGRAILHVSRQATERMDRVIGTTDSGREIEARSSERLDVLASVKALRRGSSVRRRASSRRPSLAAAGLAPVVATKEESSSKATMDAGVHLRSTDVEAIRTSLPSSALACPDAPPRTLARLPAPSGTLRRPPKSTRALPRPSAMQRFEGRDAIGVDSTELTARRQRTGTTAREDNGVASSVRVHV